jgi:hypothetical protein
VKILFDQGTPVPLRVFLQPHTVVTAYERGWDRWQNGELLKAAEAEDFDVLVTTDSGIKYQQNLSGRKIAIVVLLSTSWPKIQAKTSEVESAVQSIPAGGYIEVVI